ncbi:MAG: hypothetical protein COV67_07295 [Nitrospinae bacterium CG11_big_fil_rev_8_21_14_0_20_56_8]|nr:MAG: hypothetical protein COV67_07295 [Nitrospinae bacterium CG11_big_fil_rev_8_21_14_0_20_56_8]
MPTRSWGKLGGKGWPCRRDGSRACVLGLLLGVVWTVTMASLFVEAGELPAPVTNDVAAITPDMELLQNPHGTLSPGNGTMLPDAVAQAGSESGTVESTSGSVGSPPGTKLSISSFEYLRAGFLVREDISVGSIIGAVDRRVTFNIGDSIYIDVGEKQGVAKGDRFTVFQKDREVYHPVEVNPDEIVTDTLSQTLGKVFTEKPEARQRRIGEPNPMLLTPPAVRMGFLAKILGTIEVVETGPRQSRAKVTHSFDEIHAGNLLMPYEEHPVPSVEASSGAEKSIEAYVVAFKYNLHTAMENDIVYMDKGSRDNVEVGDIFEAYDFPPNNEWAYIDLERTGKPFLPVKVGKLQVVATGPDTSTLVVIHMLRDLRVGHRLRYKQ